jgi:hypothetical protein
LAADERLRLATQLSPAESDKIKGHKMAAQGSYVKAKEYQKAIDILLELAARPPTSKRLLLLFPCC